MGNIDALLGQGVDQHQDAVQRIEKGAGVGELRADMAVHALDGQVRQAGGVGVHLRGAGDINAEFIVAQAGGNIGVRFGVDIGIDANRHRRHHAHLGGHGVEPFQFGF